MNLALVGQPWVSSLERCSETNNVVPAGDDVCGGAWLQWVSGAFLFSTGWVSMQYLPSLA